jgi:hypothetical protein
MRRARRAEGVAAQPGNAAAAEATAAPTSSPHASATTHDGQPAAGSKIGAVRPLVPAVRLPWMKCPRVSMGQLRARDGAQAQELSGAPRWFAPRGRRAEVHASYTTAAGLAFAAGGAARLAAAALSARVFRRDRAGRRLGQPIGRSPRRRGERAAAAPMEFRAHPGFP